MQRRAARLASTNCYAVYEFVVRAKLYGIANCDTVKKARKWLVDRGIEVDFHDFKKQGLSQATLTGWLNKRDWEALLNKRGTTWRKLSAETRDAITDRAGAARLMVEQPALIRRPVLDMEGNIYLGFNEEVYSEIFEKQPE